MSSLKQVISPSAAAAAVVLAGAVVAGCSSGGSSTAASAPASPTASTGVATSSGAGLQKPVPVESNPPGDIPDNVAFVPYRNTPGHYTLTVPEGWARTESGSSATFTDKLNGLVVDGTAGLAPDVSGARSTEIPRLRSSQPAFELMSVEAAHLPAGSGTRIVFRRNSAPDPVTGRQYRDEVVEYVVGNQGRVVRLELFGPVGADNVDAYRTISTSVRIA